MLINSPLTRLRLAYWFFPPTFLLLQKLLCTITFLWHSPPTANNLTFECALIPSPFNDEGHPAVVHMNIAISASSLCLPPCRLKKKSQSVDIASQGFSPTLVPASPLNKAAPPVAKTTTVLAVQENNTTNSQRRSPRCGELKRGYTIGKWHGRCDPFMCASGEHFAWV